MHPIQDAYAPIKESFSKVAAGARAAKAKNPTLGFRTGASLLGGEIRQNGKLSYTVVLAASKYILIGGFYGNDFEFKFEVKDSTGKPLALKVSNGDTAEFTAPAGRYTISVTNVGADTFVALGAFQVTGGVNHSFNGINTAINRMAASIQRGFGDGFGLGMDSAAVIGSALPPGGNFGRASSKEQRWTAIATSDGKPGSIRLAAEDKAKNILQEDNGEDVDCVMVFNKALADGAVRVSNPTQQSVLAVTLIMS